MPPRWAYRSFVRGIDTQKAFEPARSAILEIMARWLGTLTIEERKKVRGVQVTFDAIEGDTFTARLLTWEDADATDPAADPTGTDAGSGALPNGKGVLTG